ncbi:hypothetical protein [Sphingomonas sp. 2SG]|uniref:hypothetical protein n=1 Tax=Sphingomonas sp. 2SG TaxID=2502201 RepID=UPI0010F4E783|nr:hypothetical protein [Sphingomonas sp. 2SG]
MSQVRQTNEAYQDRYLAFVDVLGFAELVAQSETSSEIVTRLSRTLLRLSERASSARSEELHIEATSFSDTVVISAPATSDALYRMFEITEELSFELLSANMLLRGAIVRGAVLHTSEFVFGPALISAYRLETGTSFHPRIMLEPSVYVDTKAEGESERFSPFVVLDNYDVPYLNPFARWQTLDSFEPLALGQLVQLQGIIAAGLLAGASNPSVGEKYKWLGRKLNRFIRSASSKLTLQELDVD